MIWESHPVMEDYSLSQITDTMPQNDYEDDPGLVYKVHFFDEDSHMLFNQYDLSGFIRTYVTKIIYPDGAMENVENERTIRKQS